MRRLGLVALFGLGCSSALGEGGACQPDDADGVSGGDYVFEFAVDDSAFSRSILKTQDSSNVTLTLSNQGEAAHGFSVDCLPTPNDEGCPQESCFAAQAKLERLEPGETRSWTFVTPRVEGIYTFRSPLAGDAQSGQFVVQ